MQNTILRFDKVNKSDTVKIWVFNPINHIPQFSRQMKSEIGYNCVLGQNYITYNEPKLKYFAIMHEKYVRLKLELT